MLRPQSGRIISRSSISTYLLGLVWLCRPCIEYLRGAEQRAVDGEKKTFRADPLLFHEKTRETGTPRAGRERGEDSSRRCSAHTACDHFKPGTLVRNNLSPISPYRRDSRESGLFRYLNLILVRNPVQLVLRWARLLGSRLGSNAAVEMAEARRQLGSAQAKFCDTLLAACSRGHRQHGRCFTPQDKGERRRCRGRRGGFVQ